MYGFAIHANTLGHQFAWDDKATSSSTKASAAFRDLPALFSQHAFAAPPTPWRGSNVVSSTTGRLWLISLGRSITADLGERASGYPPHETCSFHRDRVRAL